MKRSLLCARRAALAGVLLPLVLAGSALGAEHTYQVTGPVQAVTDKSITVKKGGEPWTVARDANTKVEGDLKVGSKVTVKYHMVADTVTSK